MEAWAVGITGRHGLGDERTGRLCTSRWLTAPAAKRTPPQQARNCRPVRGSLSGCRLSSFGSESSAWLPTFPPSPSQPSSPLYVTGFLGLSTIAYGLIDGLNQGASAIVRIAAGWASDRTGNPKRVAMAGYGLSMLARIGLLFVGGFWSLIGIVAGDRIGEGIRTAPRDALISAEAQPEHLARSFGVHRMLDNIGAAAGPLLAFLVLLLIPNGFGTVFVVSVAFAVIGVAVLVLVVPDLRTPRGGGADRRASCL
jgi:MFS family permease